MCTLVDDDRARERRRVRGLLLGALRDEQLTRVDRKADGKEQCHHHDRGEDDRLAAFVAGERLHNSPHLWMYSDDPPLSVIWNALPNR